MVEAFGLDPSVVHLNHGAFGLAPTVVRAAATAWREHAERNPHRFNRVEVPSLIAEARTQAADYLGVAPSEVGWVRNVSEGVSAVLGSIDLAPGDELVTSRHGYGAVRMALEHWAQRRGATVREAVFPVGATDDEVVEAYVAACSARARLVVVDQITSPTARVLPVAMVAAAVDPPVLVDAAHVPGSLPTKVGDLGATWWVGNLHKWAYTPRGAGLLWRSASAPATWPSVLSWQVEDGYAESFDYPGTWDYAAWLAVPDGLAFWAQLGGWEQVSRLTSLVAEGQRHLASALGTSLEDLPATPAPTMRLVQLPEGLLQGPEDAKRLYERLSVEHRIEVGPIVFEEVGYLRVAAAPYNTRDDYDRLADALQTI
jgi:isopenicillin-N epimerase